MMISSPAGSVALMALVAVAASLGVPMSGIIAVSIPMSPKWGLGASSGTGAVEFRLIDVLIPVAAASILLRTAGHIKVNRQHLLFTPFLVIGFLSTLLGLVMGTTSLIRGTLVMMKEFSYFVLPMIVMNLLKLESKNRTTLRMILGTAIVCGVLAAGQFITGHFWGTEGRRASLPFDLGPFPLAGYALSVLPVAFGLASCRQYSPFSALATVSALAALVLSGSRSCMLAGAAALIVCNYLLRPHRRLRLPHPRSIAMLVMLAVATGWMLTKTGLGQRFSTLMQVGAGGLLMGIRTNARATDMWPAWYAAFGRSPVVGAGVGATVESINGPLSFADNYYVLTLGERGVLGLLAFLLASAAWSLYLIRRARCQEGVSRAVMLGAAASTVGFLVASFGTDAFRVTRPAESYWFVQGLAAFYSCTLTNNGCRSGTHEEPNRA